MSDDMRPYSELPDNDPKKVLADRIVALIQESSNGEILAASNAMHDHLYNHKTGRNTLSVEAITRDVIARWLRDDGAALEIVDRFAVVSPTPRPEA
jgi:hypothetical protein